MTPFLLILYLIPFLITTVVPGLFLPTIVSKIFLKNSKNEHFNFLPFVVSLTVLSVGAILFWEFGLFNHVYGQWDRFYFPYNFFFFELPGLNSSNANWLAPGWTLWHLYLIWLVTTFGIYFVTLFVCFRFSRKYKNSYLYRKVILISISLFILLTLVASVFKFHGISNEIAASPKNWNAFISFVNEEKCVREWGEGCVQLFSFKVAQTSSMRNLREAIDSLQLKKVSSENIAVGVVNTSELKCTDDTQSQTYVVMPMESNIFIGINFKCWFIKPFPQELRIRTNKK